MLHPRRLRGPRAGLQPGLPPARPRRGHAGRRPRLRPVPGRALVLGPGLGQHPGEGRVRQHEERQRGHARPELRGGLLALRQQRTLRVRLHLRGE